MNWMERAFMVGSILIMAAALIIAAVMVWDEIRRLRYSQKVMNEKINRVIKNQADALEPPQIVKQEAEADMEPIDLEKIREALREAEHG